MNSAMENPRDIPMDSLGSSTPTTPPTSAQQSVKIAKITPNNFMAGSETHKNICDV